MIIGVTGATGFIGRTLLLQAHERGHEVIAFTREPARSVDGALETRRFSVDAPLDLSGCEAIVHLAGEPIAGFWTSQKRQRIVDSRVQGTRRIVEAIASMENKPEVLVNASAVGFYGNGGGSELSENAPAGSGFLAETTAAYQDGSVEAGVEDATGGASGVGTA